MSGRDRSSGRTRNVPHPDPDGTERKHRSRPEASLHGTRSRRHDRGSNPSNGLPRRRVAGSNGSWPALGDAPKPPAFLALYDCVGEEPEAVFGQYPRALIGKLLPWLGCERREVLHVCSGSLPKGEGIRVDIRPEARPDVLADGRRLPFADGSIAAVLIDPPYTAQYAKDLYGVDYPRPSHLLAEAARVVRPCGRIGFVHYLVPMPPPRCQHVKTLGLSTGFGFHMRAVTVFQKEQDALPLSEPVARGRGRRP